MNTGLFSHKTKELFISKHFLTSSLRLRIVDKESNFALHYLGRR